MFEAFVLLAGVVAGGIASLAGFGIGSVLTPVLAASVGTKLAVAAVSIPHVVGTAVRLWTLRAAIDRRVLLQFGLPSAVGGLAGALLHARSGGMALTVVFGLLLVFAGATGLSGLDRRMRFGRRMAWVAGAFSGLLGGLVGNQGGIRSAALLGFDVGRDAFIATATATALIVDGARLPVYLSVEGEGLREIWVLIAVATVGVLAGTLGGRQLLRRIPEPAFRRVVSVLLLGLGGYMLMKA